MKRTVAFWCVVEIESGDVRKISISGSQAADALAMGC